MYVFCQSMKTATLGGWLDINEKSPASATRGPDGGEQWVQHNDYRQVGQPP